MREISLMEFLDCYIGFSSLFRNSSKKKKIARKIKNLSNYELSRPRDNLSLNTEKKTGSQQQQQFLFIFKNVFSSLFILIFYLHDILQIYKRAN